MTSIEAKEVLNNSSHSLTEENFPFGAFVIDAGMIVDAINKHSHRTHLVTNVPTDLQASALGRDFSMIAPAHSLAMPTVVRASETGLNSDDREIIHAHSQKVDNRDILVIVGINKVIGISNEVDESMHRLLEKNNGPKVVGIGVGNIFPAEEQNLRVLSKFDNVRPFETRIIPTWAFQILAEHYSTAHSESIVQSLRDQKRLTWHNVISISNRAMEEAAARAA